MGRYYLNNEELTKSVLLFQRLNMQPERNAKALVDAGKVVAKCFKTLARAIVTYAKFNAADLKPRTLEKCCILAAFDNVHKYNPTKGKCFNYMTTIMLNELHKEYKIWRKRQDRENKYCQFLER